MTPDELALDCWENEGGFIDLRFDDEEVAKPPTSVEIRTPYTNPLKEVLQCQN